MQIFSTCGTSTWSSLIIVCNGNFCFHEWTYQMNEAYTSQCQSSCTTGWSSVTCRCRGEQDVFMIEICQFSTFLSCWNLNNLKVPWVINETAIVSQFGSFNNLWSVLHWFQDNSIYSPFIMAAKFEINAHHSQNNARIRKDNEDFFKWSS